MTSALICEPMCVLLAVDVPKSSNILGNGALVLRKLCTSVRIRKPTSAAEGIARRAPC